MMRLKRLRTQIVQALLVAITSAAAGHALADDPGELFPNVKPYDETVSAPVSRPDKAIRITPPVSPVPEPVKIVKIPKKVPGTQPAKDPLDPPKEVAKAPEPPARPVVDVSFHPYMVSLNKPLIDAADSEVFDKEYADQITKALAGRVEDRRKLSLDLAVAADQTKSDSLKRFLLLHSLGLSIRGGVSLEDRTARANAVLPMLNEKTLAITQAKADCLNDLMLSATLNPTDKMLDLYTEAFATLARMQVQTGYPKDAQDSLKKSRETLNKCKERVPGRSEQVIEATAWVERANKASGLWPRWQQTLKSTPNDPLANTQCALLHLALYGNPEAAGPFAARSDKKDLQKLAAAVTDETASEENRRNPLKIYAVCLAVADVSRTSAVNPFDKFSLAMLAGNKIEFLIDSDQLPADKAKEARKQLDALREQVEKGEVKPSDPPKWMGSTKVAEVKAKPAEDPNKGITGIVDIFKDCPKGTLPKPDDTGMQSVKAANVWLGANAVGKKIVIDAAASYFGQLVAREDGTKYVPVTFTMPNHEVQGYVFRVEIESRMSPALAERAGNLQRGEVAKIGGTVISARIISYYGEGGVLRLVIGEKAK